MDPSHTIVSPALQAGDLPVCDCQVLKLSEFLLLQFGALQ